MLPYKNIIEKNFAIVKKDGVEVPFLLNPVQDAYLELLKNEYPTFDGIRENILKARQEGFSAFIDALLVCDFLALKNIGAQIISHKKEETEVLFNRVSFYIDSFCKSKKIARANLLSVDTKGYLENKVNGSYIFIGTAGAKTLGRGGTLQNIHWSEVAFYPDTEILNAEKLVSAAEQQVAVGLGKIFRETTGNMMGDYYHGEVERSQKGESTFKFRFFPWFKNPEYTTPIVSAFTPTDEERRLMTQHALTQEQVLWYRNKSREFKTRTLFLREYPSTPEEAFLASGSGFFDPDVLKQYYDKVRDPIKTGMLAFDGSFL